MEPAATPRRSFKRGSLPNQIEFDPGRALSTTGGNGDLYRGILHLSSHANGSPFQYSNVALKRMRWGTEDEDNRLDNIIEETYIWKRVIHPNILRFLGLLCEDEDIYLVAPFAQHGTLTQYIVAHPDTDRPMFLWQVSTGIAHLHKQNIVHGDLKGANILIFNGPTVKICDFGLAKFFDGKQTTNPQYSLPWTSPERLLGKPRSFSSDVYAFGMTIYEILSGKTPFGALGGVACIQAILNGEHPPKHPELSSTGISYAVLWALAERCWQSLPEERPSMDEVLDLIAPAEENLVAEGDLDGLPILFFPPAASDVADQKWKGASTSSGPKTNLGLDEPGRSPTEVIRTAEAALDVESSRDANILKIHGEGVAGEVVEAEWIVHSPGARHVSQQGTAMNTWVDMHQIAPPHLPKIHLDDETDELRIVGAAVVRHHELKTLRPVQPQNRNGTAGFWKDLVEADVSGKRSLVKMYYEKSGGESAFLRDLKRLGDCLFGLPRVRAYCLKSSIPFIVLEAESTRPLKDHLLDLAKSLTADIADRKIWITIATLNAAASFVSENCQDILMSSLSTALEDARVDQDGQVVLTPGWSNTPGPNVECEIGATELTRGMLNKFLMGDHAFHRLWCILFTSRAESWNYMTRDDVLNLSDKDAAKAHFCAHGDVSRLSAEEQRAVNQVCDAWTQCSCLNHGAALPPVRRSVIPRFLTLPNQALLFGLSSQVKTAVSNIINAIGFETISERNTKSATQEPETLPPKIWARLLVADVAEQLQLQLEQQEQEQWEQREQREQDMRELQEAQRELQWVQQVQQELQEKWRGLQEKWQGVYDLDELAELCDPGELGDLDELDDEQLKEELQRYR